MFITFYNRKFEALANNSSLNVESFALKRRAYDVNEFSAVCEPIDLDIMPLFATLKTNDGTRYHDVLSPIIMRDDNNRSNIVARDLMGVFNTKCIIDFSKFRGSTAKEYLQFLFDEWQKWDECGFDNVVLNLNDVNTTDDLIHPEEKATYNIKELFSKTLAFYDLFMQSEIDMRDKQLIFRIRRNNSRILSVRLEDFGIKDFAKYEPEINTAVAVQKDGDGNYTIDSSGNIDRRIWYLLQSGEITNDKTKRNVFPVSTEIIENESFDEAVFEAIMLLAENRYQESIPIDTTKDERLKDIDFTTSFDVYYRGKFYKRLPIGEIDDDGTENKIIRLGFKPIDIIQLL